METFVDKLTEYTKDESIQYHVSRILDDSEYDENNTEYEYNGAHCFDIKQRMGGPQKAIFYDVDAIKYSIDYIKKYNLKEPVIYVLACRIGPFIGKFKRQIHELGGQLYVNPDMSGSVPNGVLPLENTGKYQSVLWLKMLICLFATA